MGEGAGGLRRINSPAPMRHALSITIDTPTKGRGGCSRMCGRMTELSAAADWGAGARRAEPRGDGGQPGDLDAGRDPGLARAPQLQSLLRSLLQL